PGWERWRLTFEEAAAPIREWLIRELAPQRGDTILELSAGVGDTGFEAAAIVGERGRLISTDFASDMVEAARRRSEELGLANVEHRVMDAEHVELEDDSVDGVLCRFGYMLMADPAAALSETRRVLRPGGRLAFAVFASAERNPWASICARLFVERGHAPPPEPGTPGIFALGSEERTRGLLEEAGFTNVRMEEVPMRFLFTDLDEYLSWATNTAGALAMVLRGLPGHELEWIEAELERAFAPFAVDGGYELPGVALVAVAS
ncbi:MAG: class I SAM-dependent methyltransferase, partial [Gaiellaceae bacterium]